MAPKAKSKPAKAAPPVKASPPMKVKSEAPEPELCIAGKSGKSLQNAVSYKLSKAPSWVRDVWSGKLRYDKTMSSDQKKEFISSLLSTSDYSEPYWLSSKSQAHTSSEGSKSKWISWKAVLQQEDEATATLMVAQGRLQKRKHAGLDHDAEATKALPEECQHQFKWVTDFDTEAVSTEDKWENGATSDQAPEVVEAVEEPPKIEVPKVATKSVMKQAINQFAMQEADLQSRLSTYSANTYTSARADECMKEMKALRKLHAKVKALYCESEALDETNEATALEAAEQIITMIKDLKKSIAGMRSYAIKIEGPSTV